VRRAASVSLVLAIGLVLGVSTGSQAQSVISPEELLDRLARSGGLAEAGAGAPSSVRMDALRAALGLPVVVRLAGGEMTIEPDPVLDGLTGDDVDDFRRAADRLAALRASVERAIAAGPIDRGAVETALASAYRGSLQVDPGLIERVRRAAAELIQNLLSRLFSFRGAGTLGAWAVLVGLGVLALWLVRRLRLVPETTMEETGTGARAPRIDWIARAEDAFRAGDLHGAVHSFYRGLLAALSGRGLLIDAPGLTAGECRSTVRAVRPDLFRAVSDATGTFERVAYGGAAPGPDEVETLRNAVTLARSA
jgi:hypothetical protein